MGCRFSASTTPEAVASSTSAKVVTVTGTLREYSAAPFPASIVLADCKAPAPAAETDISSSSYFLCNSDDLVFDAPITALAPDDPVLPGRLYFVLPDSMRRRKLSGADMGALAVRASKALEAAAGKVGRIAKKKGRALKVSPVVDVNIVGKKGYFDDGCVSDKQRTAAAVGSAATRRGPVQLKRSAAGAAVAGQKRGPGATGGGRYARRGGSSFRGRLVKIEEEE